MLDDDFGGGTYAKAEYVLGSVTTFNGGYVRVDAAATACSSCDDESCSIEEDNADGGDALHLSVVVSSNVVVVARAVSKIIDRRFVNRLSFGFDCCSGVFAILNDDMKSCWSNSLSSF